MKMNCSEIKEYIKESSANLFKCTEYKKYLVLTTPFFYPDGDEIELFMDIKDDRLILSDMGETFRYLDTYNFDVLSTNRRKEIVNEVIASNNVRLSKGIIYAVIKNPVNILEATINICQSIIRISDLLYTVKGHSLAAFEEEVKSFLDEHKLIYQEEYKVETSVSSYQFEFAIESRKGIILLKLMNAPKKNTAPPVDRIVRIWFDISTEFQKEFPKENRITILDDSSYRWLPSQYAVIEKLSIVNLWSKKERLLQNIS